MERREYSESFYAFQSDWAADTGLLLHREIRLGGSVLQTCQTEQSKEMRNRFRRMIQLWNDSRVCSLNEFVAKEWNDQDYYTSMNDFDTSYGCQIVYSFVLGAYSNNATMPHYAHESENIPKVRMHETPTEPLVLKMGHKATALQKSGNISGLPYSDVLEHEDGIFLNIVENQGKTPTYLHWASKIFKQFKIPYVAKCDTDTFIRLHKMLDFRHQELPRTPARGINPTATRPQQIMSGSLRHKPWKGGFLPTVDESFGSSSTFMACTCISMEDFI